MDYIQQLRGYTPINDQEREDTRVILEYARQNPHNVLLRQNKVAHITSSGFIVNPSFTKSLMVYHNIRQIWAWTGGHADGETNLLKVALQEAQEETGAAGIRPLFPEIASVDILFQPGHYKNGEYVNSHLHLSVAYILACDECEAVRIKPDENQGVEWIPVEHFTPEFFKADPADAALYNKLVQKARAHRGATISLG